MGKYAQRTKVGPERSRIEIERMLSRYGATRFASGWTPHGATIAFEANSKRVRFVLAIPKEAEFETTPTGRQRDQRARALAVKQEEQRRWRALALVVKAKLEAIASGVSTFEDEFLAHFVMPSGETVKDWLAPRLDKALEGGKLPPLLKE